MCDHCRQPKITEKRDITRFCKDIFSIIEKASENGVKLTLLKLMDSWYQTGAKDLRVSSITKPGMKRTQAERVVAFLLLKGFLKEEKSYTAYAVNCYVVRKVSEVEGRVEMPWEIEGEGWSKKQKMSECKEDECSLVKKKKVKVQ